ncbi:Gfo/Idh/MocA family protein [Terriglobus tenax]|uniref:Gfo/Idh/MocA family protein n=1 Tax=Terriglobus tenax TaxID=1111115 RepID=UPI0021E07616|nr:Gfo/Idh/MocA family oxidoreductase [Terriglobus tenax]
MMGTRLKVGVIGLGAWGCNVARCLYEMPECDLVVCSDLSENRRTMAQRNWGVQTVASLDEMLAHYPEINAVVISSPAITHYSLAKKALLADKDVFVEKPFTLNVRDAEELAALADARNRILMVGHLLEYHPAVNRIREIVQSGDLGDIYYIYTQRVNLGRIRGDENALWSFAPHDISQILYILGEEPVDVSARGQSFIQDGIEDVVFLSLFFENRRMAHIHISWLDPHKMRSTTVVGSKKMLVFDDAAATEKLRIYDSGAQAPPASSYGEAIQVRFGDIQIPRLTTTEPLKLEFQHFLYCVEHRVTPRSDSQDGLRVVRILEAAQKSLEMDGLPVSLNPNAPEKELPPAPPINRQWTPRLPMIPNNIPVVAAQ